MKSEIAEHWRTWTAWGGALCGLACIGLFSAKPSTKRSGQVHDGPEEALTVFNGKLAPGWQDRSSAEHQIPDPEIKNGTEPAIRFEPGAGKGLYLRHDTFSTDGYEALAFSVRGCKPGAQKITVCTVDEYNKSGPEIGIAAFAGGGSRPADLVTDSAFVSYMIPLSRLKADETRITGLCFQDASGRPQAPVYISSIHLTVPTDAARNLPLNITIHGDRELGPISDYIYGMAQPGKTEVTQLRLKLLRWGGNPASRYNWEKGNCWNAAADWEFRNGNYGSTSPEARRPSGVADKSVASARAAGADILLTIPTLGWVARDDDSNNASSGVPAQGGPPVAPGSDAIAGYDPAQNRERVSERSLPRKGRPFTDPPDLKDNVVYQDEWVFHLTHKFGPASKGGVRFYAMDNEPDLWSSTHRDMHPVQPDYQEVLQQFLTYSTAVKDVDPSAQITGPVSWGWTGMQFSPRDAGTDNYATAADRTAHGGLPFLAWFLQQVAAYDKRQGRRTLDVLDVHLYPQGSGVYAGATDEVTNRLRLRSVRALWDPNYIDESWIAANIMLLPRLRNWIDQYYPGTKLGLTEWNWGADSTLNGGLAVGEVLGVLGRERVDMACYWTAPGPGTPGFYAWKMYRNADDAGHGFGDIAVSAECSDSAAVSCYASVQRSNGLPVVMLINKMAKTAKTVNIKIVSKRPVLAADAFRYSNADLKSIAHLPNIVMAGDHVSLELPAYSMTLLRCK